MEQLLLVKDLEDPEEARLKGNEHFKALSSCLRIPFSSPP